MANILKQIKIGNITYDIEPVTAYLTNGSDYNLLNHGNEFTFVPSGYSGSVYFNYRTTGGTNGNITEYVLGNGKGGSLGTIIHSGNIGSQSVSYATSAGSVPWGSVTNKPSTFPPESHTHNYLPLSGFTGTLDLKNSANGIKFNSKNHYVTNMQIGEASLAMNSVANGSIRTVTVSFDDYFKGEGYWYVIATAKGESNSAVPDSIVVSVTELTPSGFTIKARKIVNATGSGSPYIHVHYVAIKYS